MAAQVFEQPWFLIYLGFISFVFMGGGPVLWSYHYRKHSMGLPKFVTSLGHFFYFAWSVVGFGSGLALILAGTQGSKLAVVDALGCLVLGSIISLIAVALGQGKKN